MMGSVGIHKRGLWGSMLGPVGGVPGLATTGPEISGFLMWNVEKCLFDHGHDDDDGDDDDEPPWGSGWHE